MNAKHMFGILVNEEAETVFWTSHIQVPKLFT